MNIKEVRNAENHWDEIQRLMRHGRQLRNQAIADGIARGVRGLRERLQGAGVDGRHAHS